jgi:hypothetical protein
MSDSVFTPELRSALARQSGRPLRVVDPDTNRVYLIMPAELFDRLTAGVYDDGPWTDEERVQLAARAGLAIGWAEMDEYDNYPDAPK